MRILRVLAAAMEDNAQSLEVVVILDEDFARFSAVADKHDRKCRPL